MKGDTRIVFSFDGTMYLESLDTIQARIFSRSCDPSVFYDFPSFPWRREDLSRNDLITKKFLIDDIEGDRFPGMIGRWLTGSLINRYKRRDLKRLDWIKDRNFPLGHGDLTMSVILRQASHHKVCLEIPPTAFESKLWEKPSSERTIYSYRKADRKRIHKKTLPVVYFDSRIVLGKPSQCPGETSQVRRCRWTVDPRGKGLENLLQADTLLFFMDRPLKKLLDILDRWDNSDKKDLGPSRQNFYASLLTILMSLCCRKDLPWDQVRRITDTIADFQSSFGFPENLLLEGAWSMLTMNINEKQILRHPEMPWNYRRVYFREDMGWFLVRLVEKRLPEKKDRDVFVQAIISRFPLKDVLELFHGKSLGAADSDGLPDLKTFDFTMIHPGIIWDLWSCKSVPLRWLVRGLMSIESLIDDLQGGDPEADPILEWFKSSRDVFLDIFSGEASVEDYILFPCLRRPRVEENRFSWDEVRRTKHLYDWSLDELIYVKGIDWDALSRLLLKPSKGNLLFHEPFSDVTFR